MTREEYARYWTERLLGMALMGLVLDSDERIKGPLTAGARALELPGKIQRLVNDLWTTAQPQLPTSNGAANGAGRPPASPGSPLKTPAL